MLLHALEELGIDAVDLDDEGPSLFESVSHASAASNVPEDVKPPNGDEEMSINGEFHSFLRQP